MLADQVGRQALHCIRCSACLNVCPVYTRTGGHAYESVYPGPIGAILTPQLEGLDAAPTLPWASSLCGACYEVCPVKIDIPTVLVHLRGRVVREVKSRWSPERLAMDAAVARVPLAQGATSARSGWRAPATARSPGCPARCGAGRRCATCPTSRSSRSATGGHAERRWPSAKARDPRPHRRGALGPAPAVPDVPRAYHRAGSGAAAGSEAVVARFCERAAEYRATVRRVARGDLEDAVVAACREQGARRLAVPPGAPHHLPGLELVVDDPPMSARGARRDGRRPHRLRARRRRDRHVVLDGGERSGRRALTLVPDFHVCLVEAARIHASVPDAIAALAPGGRRGPPDHLRLRARAPRRTSSSSASRACTARARS